MGQLKGKIMTVKELIKELSKFPPNKKVVVWNEALDDNYWRIDISEDEINNADVVLYPNNKKELKDE